METPRQDYSSYTIMAGIIGVAALVVLVTLLVIRGSARAPVLETVPQASVIDSSNNADPGLEISKYLISEGDTIVSILQEQADIDYEHVLDIVEQIDQVHDVRRIRLGQEIVIMKKGTRAVKLTYDINLNEMLVIELSDLGVYEVSRQEIIYERHQKVKRGEISTSMYFDAQASGLVDKTIMELATMFAWDIDFSNSIQKGDTFIVVYDDLYRNGEFVGPGKIEAARFVNNGNEFSAYYVATEKFDGEYFAEDGEAKKRAFLKTPLNFTRISSGFSRNRLHPVSGDWKSHRALDLAAPTGTPIESVANGTVTFAGTRGAAGKYVKIKHPAGFETAYAHLSRIDVQRGQTVNQGQVIGLVGSTGRSTGPHLHYEMYKNGNLVHPFNTKTPRGEPLMESMKPLLEQRVQQYKHLL